MTRSSQKVSDLDRLISQKEAAELRGVSKQAIADLIKRGRLSTVTVAGRKLLIRNEVAAFVAQPKTGRPPKKQAARKQTKKSTSAKKTQ